MTSWGKLQSLVEEWRNSNYDSDFPLLAEILYYQQNEHGQLTYLRDPQFRALEVYWFLRIKLGTPKFLELYNKLYQKPSEKLEALGITPGADVLDFSNLDDYLRHVAQRSENSALAESLSFDYASYIMALTMGAGKTVLIGAIIATEFAMSLEYDSELFMKNALVFAPGTTIIESLKEISDIPYGQILPARMCRKFRANVKLVYVQKNSKDLQVDKGGSYHVIVTNTERITLKKRPIKKGQLQFDYNKKQEQEKLVANARLNAIVSLPQLGVFSDEAHHTYGNKLGEELKRVRETINYLHDQANLVCVVNTTGTPYAGTQTLMDVVFWYSLDQGIKDGILKSLTNSVIAYDFKDTPPAEIFDDVIADFFAKYRDTQLITGQQAKIAFYFKSQEHLEESRPLIEKALAKVSETPAIILVNTQLSSKQDIEEFKRLNDPDAARRVILLVGKGTEGWNCPSLFATALIREVTDSNNFVLQASTRCLRQVEGNNQPATIYVESHNQRILNDELQKTFGTTLYAVSNIEVAAQETNLIFRKTLYPELEITKTFKRIVRGQQPKTEIVLRRPSEAAESRVFRDIFTPQTEASGVVLSNTGEETEITFVSDSYDLFTAAQSIANNYHLKTGDLYAKLAGIYTDGEVPRSHLAQLFVQVEQQTTNYEEQEQNITQALVLIKFSDSAGNATFPKDKSGSYYHTIRYSSSKEKLITQSERYASRNAQAMGFHYDPYDFDSEPERAFFEAMLERLQIKHDEVHDIYFTGSLTEQKYTDLFFQYKAFDGRYHNYFPDFVIVKKDGSFLIVEIKAEGKQNDADVQAKEKEVKRLEQLPGNRFKYHVLYTDVPIPEIKLRKVTEMLK